MLTPEEILELEEVLFADAWAEDALDFFGLHGLVCANAVGPQRLPTATLFTLATGQDEGGKTSAPEVFTRLCDKLFRSVRSTLEQGETLELPEPEDGDPDNALQNWCAGFVEAFLYNEDAWLETKEETVAELLVPIMTLSDFFDDADFQAAREDETLSQELAEHIPDTLTDLYLLFHSPE